MPPGLYLVIQSGVCIKKFCINCSVSPKVLTNNYTCTYYDCWLAIAFKNAYQGVLDQLQLFAVYKPQSHEGAVRSKTKQKSIGDHHSFHAQIVDP